MRSISFWRAAGMAGAAMLDDGEVATSGRHSVGSLRRNVTRGRSARSADDESPRKSAGFAAGDAAMIERERQRNARVNFRRGRAGNDIALQFARAEDGDRRRNDERRRVAARHGAEVRQRERVVAHFFRRDRAATRALLQTRRALRAVATVDCAPTSRSTGTINPSPVSTAIARSTCSINFARRPGGIEQRVQARLGLERRQQSRGSDGL